MARLEFELTYLQVVAQHFNYYATKIPIYLSYIPSVKARSKANRLAEGVNEAVSLSSNVVELRVKGNLYKDHIVIYEA